MPKKLTFDIDRLFTFNEEEVKKAAEQTLAVWTPVKAFKSGEVEEKKHFRLTGFNIATATETIMTLEDEATVFFVMLLAPVKTNIEFVFPQAGYISKLAGNKLNLKLSATAKITGVFFGIEDFS